MQSSHVVSLSSAAAGCAALHSTTRDHCSALGIILAETTGCAAGAPPWFPAQTPSLPYGTVIICAVLTCALGYSAPVLPRWKPAAPLRVRRSSR